MSRGAPFSFAIPARRRLGVFPAILSLLQIITCEIIYMETASKVQASSNDELPPLGSAQKVAEMLLNGVL